MSYTTKNQRGRFKAQGGVVRLKIIYSEVGRPKRWNSGFESHIANTFWGSRLSTYQLMEEGNLGDSKP